MIAKRINIRVEHVKHSHSRDDFLRRVKYNEKARKEAQAAGKPKPLLKRQPAGPRPGHFVSTKKNAEITLAPVPYQILA